MVVSLLSFRVPWVIVNITTNTSHAKRLDCCMRLGPIPNTCEHQIAAPAPSLCTHIVYPSHAISAESPHAAFTSHPFVRRLSRSALPDSGGSHKETVSRCWRLVPSLARPCARRLTYTQVHRGTAINHRNLSLTGTHTQRSYINVVVGFSSAAHAISPSRLHAVIVCSAYTDILLFILVMFI